MWRDVDIPLTARTCTLSLMIDDWLALRFLCCVQRGIGMVKRLGMPSLDAVQCSVASELG